VTAVWVIPQLRIPPIPHMAKYFGLYSSMAPSDAEWKRVLLFMAGLASWASDRSWAFFWKSEMTLNMVVVVGWRVVR
jgi:hypothetical protein